LSRTNSILKMRHQLRTRNLKLHLRKKGQRMPHLIRIIKMQVLTLASSTAYQIRLRATKMKEANNLAGTKQEVLKLERRMSKHLGRLPGKIQEITTRDRVIITIEEEVVDTKKEATIKVEVGITTKILATTAIAVAAATAKVVVAMAGSMKEAAEATLIIKEVEEAIINPSTMREALGDKTLSNGETTTAEAKIATTEVAVVLDRVTILIKMAVITKAGEVVQTLISTNRDPLVPNQLKVADIRF